jgi:hypothetical protein
MTGKGTGQKVCFVIAPIGGPKSPERRHSDRVYKHIIQAAAERCGYTPLPAKEIPGSGLIIAEVIKHVVSAPLVIADLTGGNANVFYELALRHAVRRPIVQIIASDEEIEFDVSHIRTLQFDIDDVIDDPNSEKETIRKLIDYIREAEGNSPHHGTPVSIAGLNLWTPSRENDSRESSISSNQEDAESVLRGLLSLPQAEALPAISKYIKDLTKDPSVRLLATALEDLSAAVDVVNNVPEGGHISATSSLQYDDADAQVGYRSAVNLALERKVTYRKVICASSELWPERHRKWLEEFQDKAELIRKGKIPPQGFILLHHPSPMFVDVLIAQASSPEYQEMVIGFAAGGGKHGGFRTADARMVKEWMNIYLESRIIAEADQHTKAVLERKEECRCLEFLELLENAREAVTPPSPSPSARKLRSSRPKSQKGRGK